MPLVLRNEQPKKGRKKERKKKEEGWIAGLSTRVYSARSEVLFSLQGYYRKGKDKLPFARYHERNVGMTVDNNSL